jgi:putrescine transport system permease protein
VPATILGHTVFSVSFVALIVRARMGDVGRSYEEASMVLGANRLQTFGRVVLPIASPAIIAGSFLAFAASFDDVVKSIFTMGRDLLPIRIFADAHRGGIQSPLLALATIMVLISLSAAFLRVFTETRLKRE